MNTQSRLVVCAKSSRLLRDDRGLSTVEYVIILVLIAVAAISAWSLLGDTIRGKIKTSNDELSGMGTASTETGKP